MFSAAIRQPEGELQQLLCIPLFDPSALQAAQGELGKAAQDFRRLHAERAELLAQWEAVAEAVRRRDADLLEAGGW